MSNGFIPFDPVSSGVAMQKAPDGDLYQAEGPNWIATRQTANNPFFNWSTDTTATDPGAGNVKGNNSDISLITEIYVSATAENGANIGSIISVTDKGDFFSYTGFEDNTNFAIFEVQGESTDNTGWFTIPVIALSTGGTFTDGQDISTSVAAASSRTRGISIERIFDGVSVASVQNPTGTGIANAIQVEFGPAQNTVTDSVQLLVDGTVRINQSGTYRFKIALQFGRSGQVGSSILLFRVTDAAGNQLGRSISALIDDADTDRYLENDTWLTVPAPVDLKFEIMRDNNGNDSGGLIATVPDPEGAGTWNDAPTAAMRAERWVSTP